MGLLGDLEKSVLGEVLGGITGKKAAPAKATKKTSESKDLKTTVENDVVNMAAEKLKGYTPDAVDKLIDDVAGSVTK